MAMRRIMEYVKDFCRQIIAKGITKRDRQIDAESKTNDTSVISLITRRLR
jgi:hypothetical protein